MSTSYTLKAEARERAGKGVARAIRREHKVPGVIYGDAKEPVNITLPAKEINLEYRKGHMFTSLCDLDVAGQKNMVLARDVQIHPVTDRVTHVDFVRVNPKTKIRVRVPVHFLNQDKCKPIKDGGVLNVVTHDVDLLCNAMEIPEHIEVDLAPVAKMGEAVKLSQVKMPAGASPYHKGRDITVATIHEPRRYEEAAPAAAAAEGAAAAPGAEGAAAAPAAGAPAAGADKAAAGDKKAGDAKAKK